MVLNDTRVIPARVYSDDGRIEFLFLENLREALARHAPDVPVVEVSRTDTGAMDDVVDAAAAFARHGDTVLLAPGCASWDMFRDYAQRGDMFADSVRRRVQR